MPGEIIDQGFHILQVLQLPAQELPVLLEQLQTTLLASRVLITQSDYLRNLLKGETIPLQLDDSIQIDQVRISIVPLPPS